MTGTAVWAVRADGKLLSNRAALEQLQRLNAEHPSTLTSLGTP